MEQSHQTPVYNAIFADRNFCQIELGEIINRGGASGKIYAVKEHPDLVAKIFHTTAKSQTNRQKLEAMLLNKPDFAPVDVEGVKYTQIAWPQALLEDDKGFCVGYLMPLINMEEAVSLDHLMQKATRQKLGLSDKYAYRIFAAYNLASMITALHRCGHYVVDLKPSNVSVYKSNMLISMVDCDGFSIKGELGRYPAEFVSEEYIYPEGMSESCQDMGEEQDKFAMAVIIFKLLNNGIHPFSGTPRKDSDMLTIQNRIEAYHYAYGLWPDKYQAPHPYSMHEYFSKDTMEMFDRAFTKGGKRPTAYEWQEHLWKLMHHLRQCKNNPDHVYFTSKGCGLCMIEDKFYHRLHQLKKQKQTPEKIRGIKVSDMKTEKVKQDKAKKQAFEQKMNQLSYLVATIILLLFGSSYHLLTLMSDFLTTIGIGAQLLVVVLLMMLFRFYIRKYQNIFPLFKKRAITEMLQVYTLICMLVSILLVNDIPTKVLELAQ